MLAHVVYKFVVLSGRGEGLGRWGFWATDLWILCGFWAGNTRVEEDVGVLVKDRFGGLAGQSFNLGFGVARLQFLGQEVVWA